MSLHKPSIVLKLEKGKNDDAPLGRGRGRRQRQYYNLLIAGKNLCGRYMPDGSGYVLCDIKQAIPHQRFTMDFMDLSLQISLKIWAPVSKHQRKDMLEKRFYSRLLQGKPVFTGEEP